MCIYVRMKESQNGNTNETNTYYRRLFVQAFLGLTLSVSPILPNNPQLIASPLPQEPIPSVPVSPENGDTPQRSSPQWEGPSFFQNTPRIELEDQTVIISTIVDGEPWVFAIPRDIYEVKGNLGDGTPFVTGLAKTMSDIIAPYINATQNGNYLLDLQPQSAIGNFIVIQKVIDSSDNAFGLTVENPYSPAPPSNKEQVPVSSSMVLRLDAPSPALQNLNPKLDEILSKEIAQLTPDEFLQYVRYFIGPYILHEFPHQMALVSDQYIYYTLENGNLVRVVRILLENSAKAAQILGTDRLLRSMDISELKKDERSLELLEYEWSRYFKAVFGSSYNPSASDQTEYGSMLPTSSTDTSLKYDQAMILIYLMSQFGQTNSLAELEKQFINGFHYESIPYHLVDEIPQDEIVIEELYEQLIRIYPERKNITPEQIRFQIAALIGNSMRFQKAVNGFMQHGFNKSDAISQALNDMSINSPIMKSAMKAFVGYDTSGTQQAWKSREIAVNSNDSQYQSIAVKSHRGAGQIISISGDRNIRLYLASKDNLPNVTVVVYRDKTKFLYNSGDILQPGDTLFCISNRDPDILDIQDEKPIYDKLPVGIIEVQAPLTPRQYLPFISAVRL